MKAPGNLISERPQAIREKVYTHLRDKVLCGEIPPSSRLVELHLARELGVSRTPVREALHLLEREGLVESIPRMGYLVKRIDPQEVGEICEIRAVNEALAARWALERMVLSVFDEMERNLRNSEDAVTYGDLETFIRLDSAFHQILVEASGSIKLSEWCRSLHDRMLLYRIGAFRVPGAMMQALEGHRGIFETLRAGDASGVGKAIREHLMQGKAALLRRCG
ncbi:GntR family transcriptional regulator [Desulfatiglans anilini]|uniref:GntR family transcriptional regulator n=1 Tax=Desulfatiglans anilini TaxID=90728 RepID=UPI0009FD9905|nr:GntR family transcriptional regulator [Desulfatiglans anilini]